MENKEIQQPKNPGQMVSCSTDGKLTVGMMRDAIAYLDDSVELEIGGISSGIPLDFQGFKWRSNDILQIEIIEREF